MIYLILYFVVGAVLFACNVHHELKTNSRTDHAYYEDLISSTFFLLFLLWPIALLVICPPMVVEYVHRKYYLK